MPPISRGASDLVILLALLVLTPSAWSEPLTPPPGEVDDPALLDTVTEPPHTISAHAVVYGIIGSYQGQGVALGYELAPGLECEASWFGSTVKRRLDDSVAGYHRSGRVALSAIAARFTPAAPVNLRLGAGYRVFNGRFAATQGTDVAADDSVTTATVHTFGVVASAGTVWHWRGFELGADWVGAYVPLMQAHRQIDHVPPQGDVDSLDDRHQGEVFTTDGTGPSLLLLQLYAGWAF